MKSGPKELAIYHQQVLDKENRKMAQTDFDTETMDTATERVNAVLHPASQATTAPNGAAPAEKPQRQRRQRSDVGTTRVKHEPTPGMVTVKFECSIAEGTDLLGFFVRTGRTQIAHSLVDALAKAQRAEAV